jgi:hypothetical protein
MVLIESDPLANQLAERCLATPTVLLQTSGNQVESQSTLGLRLLAIATSVYNLCSFLNHRRPQRARFLRRRSRTLIRHHANGDEAEQHSVYSPQPARGFLQSSIEWEIVFRRVVMSAFRFRTTNDTPAMNLKLLNLTSLLIATALGCFCFSGRDFVNVADSEETIPRSHESPEGIAVDLVRAYVLRDFDAFNEARAKSFCEGRTDPVNFYVMFRNYTTLFKDGVPYRETSPLCSPGRIVRVHSAVSLTTAKHREIASAFSQGWSEPTLVDVVIEDRQGNEFLHRTIVVKSKSDGFWYARPQLGAHEYLAQLLLQLPKSESVLWQIAEAKDDGREVTSSIRYSRSENDVLYLEDGTD